VKVGLLSDAHGNPVGLDACLGRLREMGVDRLYFLGDAVGYMPEPERCLRSLADAGAECQLGNHEAMLLGSIPVPEDAASAYRLDDARADLAEGREAELAAWPERRELDLDGRKVLLVHGSPDDPLQGYVYPDSDLEAFASLPYDLVVTANTHRPFVRRSGDTVVANTGSAGMPRDVGDLVAFAVYDTRRGEVTVFRVRFDAGVVRERMTGRLHPSVDACLARDDPEPFGEVLE
jgi:predicted phosphodiesterase